jgi:hypothetical protein
MLDVITSFNFWDRSRAFLCNTSLAVTSQHSPQRVTCPPRGRWTQSGHGSRAFLLSIYLAVTSRQIFRGRFSLWRHFFPAIHPMLQRNQRRYHVKNLMLVECLMKYTRFIIQCHKTLWLPSPTILVLFVFNTDVTVRQPKIKSQKNATTMENIHPSISLSPKIKLQEWLKLYWKIPQKHSGNCRNIGTLLNLEQQMTLCM